MLKAALFATICLAGATPLAARAFPLPLASSSAPNPAIIQVYGGCGVYSHRGPYGGCRPGGQAGGYVPGRGCPWGWHVGPYGRRCVPNG